MAEVVTNFYEEVRKSIDPNTTGDDVDWIELLDDTDTQIIRVSTSDSRVSVTSGSASNPFTIEITVSPSDSDINTGQTFGGSRLWFADSAGNEATPIESFSDTTLDNTDDELTITHEIEIPQIV